MSQPAPPPPLSPREQCDGDWSFWVELMETMLHGGRVPCMAKLAGCRAALQRGDAVDLRVQAHALRGSAAALCLNQLCQARLRKDGTP